MVKKVIVGKGTDAGKWIEWLIEMVFAASFFVSGLFHEASACIFCGIYGLLNI